jgi:hypothetical protein
MARYRMQIVATTFMVRPDLGDTHLLVGCAKAKKETGFVKAEERDERNRQ